jgi:hypothetical protein
MRDLVEKDLVTKPIKYKEAFSEIQYRYGKLVSIIKEISDMNRKQTASKIYTKLLSRLEILIVFDWALNRIRIM